MQYIWEYRLWNPSSMTTNDGRRVRIIDPGLRNTDAGPDFFNAKIEIDGYVWAGNVEIHYRASDWKRHGHDRDRRMTRWCCTWSTRTMPRYIAATASAYRKW